MQPKKTLGFESEDLGSALSTVTNWIILGKPEVNPLPASDLLSCEVGKILSYLRV